MPVDPRTPVIVGVGQVVHRPVANDENSWTEPLSLMCTALERAAEDASATGARSSLLSKLDELTAIPSFVWQTRDPAHAVADALGIVAGSTRVAFAGGTSPQTLLFDAAERIARGEIDTVAIVGAEAMRSRDLARKLGADVTWHSQDDQVPAATLIGGIPDALTDHERSIGLTIPVHAYALFEQALRRARGQSPAEHLDQLGRLAQRMSSIASRNEYAWFKEPTDASSITTTAPSNRMIATPYTKLLTSNVVVDMGAAIIVSSLETARAAGVPDDQMVFPHRGAMAYEQWLISERLDLSVSQAMRACAATLFGEDRRGVDELSAFDLYSCFPVVVQMAGDALGIDVWTDARPPSVTGGMTFFGGPGNNYVTHSLATMVSALRATPGATGLVTALGWYCSTHAWGVYGSAPPTTPFSATRVQPIVDAVPTRVADDTFVGTGELEAYTVLHQRDGSPHRALASVLTPGGARRLVASEHEDEVGALLRDDLLGAQVRVARDSVSAP